MKKNIILFLMLLLSFGAGAKEKEIVAIQEMVKRLIPTYAENFQFKKIRATNSKDCFALESKGGKIIVSGNNANSMAMGLNHYLKYYCLTTVSWYADIPVEISGTLPMLKEKINIEAKVDKRFFLNYCTYGYTMPFWQWKNWERLIDWMALNGINMPLAITGQEAVW
ncbi:MAG: alpha-N-acetylglucosaminidase TIM-barrel domain-containing protein, partial [Bacteroidaceae bacterium]